jgi:hypothetical protein
MFDNMKQVLLLLIFLVAVTSNNFAQADSSAVKSQRVYTHNDSVYLAKLNSNSNLMIAAGVGLCGIGGYLFYQGNKVYTTVPAGNLPQATADAETARNHKQGIIYYAAAGVGVAAGVVLVAIGARNKVEFKQRKRMMSVQSGILDNGRLGAMLTF